MEAIYSLDEKDETFRTINKTLVHPRYAQFQSNVLHMLRICQENVILTFDYAFPPSQKPEFDTELLLLALDTFSFLIFCVSTKYIACFCSSSKNLFRVVTNPQMMLASRSHTEMIESSQHYSQWLMCQARQQGSFRQITFHLNVVLWLGTDNRQKFLDLAEIERVN